MKSFCANVLLTSLVLLAVSSGAQSAVTGAACPAQIDANDCVANDLQPTGAEVISGPSACTEGETISATVRVLFDNGGGANTRYSVGFFVGEQGESAIGGNSCTFDSLQPISNSPNPLGGPYAELNGDSCGDIGKSAPTYKDIQLDQLLCKDDDGDGNVDLSYILTWENNGNRANCTNPNDPAQFDPAPPKCLSDLEYDLPIVVEKPPSIEVVKGVNPRALREPGGIVKFPISILNTSPSSSDPVFVTSITEQVDGQPPVDITSLTTCFVPIILAPGENKTCFYLNQVTGVARDRITDTVTVFGQDDEGNLVQASDSAQVLIIESLAPPQPGFLSLSKFASPAALKEPGGIVKYDVVVSNESDTPVTLNSLQDDLYGNLNGKGSCRVPQTLSGNSSTYSCSFSERVSGNPGDVITDIIIARGVDALQPPNQLVAQDSASVTITNVGSDITVTKTAVPQSVAEPGSSVTFNLRVQNVSITDTVTINSLFDSQLGVPGGTCSAGFTLAPGESYTCSYSGLVQGNAGDSVTNVIEASGRDDDGQIVFDLDAATVFITGQAPAIRVAKLAIPRFVPEAGGTVRYVVAIQNVSTASDPVTITGLQDDVNGVVTPLDSVGTCDLTNLVLQPAPDPNSFYICSFPQTLPADTAGSTVENIVTASGEDDEGTPVSAADNAIVTYIGGLLPDEPELTLVKIASPFEVPEPGGNVTYSVFVANTSDLANVNLDLTLDTLVDDIYGDVFTLSSACASLQGISLPRGEIRSCSFTEQVAGDPNDVVTDVITASATDLLSRTATASDSASVTITDQPSSISVTKTATPTTVTEPGADVTFRVTVSNTSSVDSITIDTLVDSVHGDLIATGLCAAPAPLPPGGTAYECIFVAFVGGAPGDEERNTVIARGVDDDGNPVEGSAQATVTVLDTPPAISTVKRASPSSITGGDGPVTFTFTTTNTSSIDSVTLDTLVDSVFGDLNGQGDCSVPQTLQPAESYTCTFQTSLSGVVGETHSNTVEVSGTSDDGDSVAASAQAIVSFIAALQAIPALGQAGLGLLILMLGWFGVRGVRSARSR